MESALPLVVPLHLDRRLVTRMTFGLVVEDGVRLALRACRLLGMNSHCEYHRSLRDRTRRKIEQGRHMLRLEMVVLAGNEWAHADEIAVIWRVWVSQIDNHDPGSVAELGKTPELYSNRLGWPSMGTFVSSGTRTKTKLSSFDRSAAAESAESTGSSGIGWPRRSAEPSLQK